MLIPLFLTLLLHTKPRLHHTTSHRVHRCAVKGDVQFVLLPPPPEFAHPDSLHLALPRRLMPLKATLRLDTRVSEEREEEDLIAAINNERKTRGLGPLTLDPLLTVTARAHSREMCTLNYFDHHSPTPAHQTPLDRYLAGRRAWGEGQPHSALVGENLFYASVTDAVYNAAYAHTALMASPGHRANILEPRFSKVGVGLYRDPEGRFWVTEMFLRAAQ